jgi:hypothetical protein
MKVIRKKIKVERKPILTKQDRNHFEKLNRSDRVRLISAFQVRNMATKEDALLPPIPFDEFHWSEVTTRLDERPIRRIHRSFADITFKSFREQIFLMAATIREDMRTDITNVELSRLCGHLGVWLQSMISRYPRQLQGETPVSKGRPKIVPLEIEGKLIALVLDRQAERNPMTVEDVIELMEHDGRQILGLQICRAQHRQARIA